MRRLKNRHERLVITPEVEEAVFDLLVESWFGAMELYTHWGVREHIKGAWLTRHLPVATGSDDVTTPALLARFVDDADLHPPDLDGYRMFEAEHMSDRGDPERPRSSNWSIPVRGKPHGIGLGRFAAVEGTKNILVDTVWGGLFGRGYLIRVTPEGDLTILRELWVS